MPLALARPSAATLAHALRVVFAAQARDVFARLSLARVEAGDVPDLTAWNTALANVARPLLLSFWQQGMRRLSFRPRRKARLRFDPDLFNPRILDAVDAATLTFCRATQATATADLETALRQLRAALAEGLARGEALQRLAGKVATIFASPWRAFRIAATESSRATNQGHLYAMRASGLSLRKSWLASSDACEKCLELDGREVALDEPFAIEPGGGPYAIIQAPPLHPFCFCVLQDAL